MEVLYIVFIFFTGFFSMAVAQKNGWSRFWGFLAGPVITGIIIVILGQLGLFGLHPLF